MLSIKFEIEHSTWLPRCLSVLVVQSCPTLKSHRLQPTRFLCPFDSPGKNTGVGCHFLLQGIFLTQGQNPGLLHCRRILYQLSHQEAQYPGMDSLFLFLQIFPIQESNRGPLHCRQIIYQLSYWRNPVPSLHDKQIGEKMETVTDFFPWLQNHCRW